MSKQQGNDQNTRADTASTFLREISYAIFPIDWQSTEENQFMPQ